MSSILKFKKRLGLGKPHRDSDDKAVPHGPRDDSTPLVSTPSSDLPAIIPISRTHDPSTTVVTPSAPGKSPRSAAPATPPASSPRDGAMAVRTSKSDEDRWQEGVQQGTEQDEASTRRAVEDKAIEDSFATTPPDDLAPAPPPPPSEGLGDDFGEKQATLQSEGGDDLTDRLSAWMDRGIEMLVQVFGRGGYTMFQGVLRWSMLTQIFMAVLITYLMASFHVWAVVTVPLMIAYIWLIWGVHLRSVTTLIRTQTRLNFILSGLMPEKESVWWLNMVVRACWPVFLRDFLNRKVVPKLAPWFLNKYKPPMLVSVDVMDVDMGDRGPVVSNVRVLQGVAGDSHVELEMDLEVASANNMVIQCGAKVVGMTAITWQAFVTGMHLTGTIRVGVKFSNTWESGFVERVSVMFPAPPQLSCAIRVMGGLDAASMPLVSAYIDCTLQAALNATLCWPNRIMVVDAVKAVAYLLDLPLPEGADADATDHSGGGAKQVKMTKALGGQQAATAEVEILDGEDLKVADSCGTSDPYVKGVLGPARFTTGVIQKSLNPVWVGEKYELPIVDWTTSENFTLSLKVRDYDKFSSDDELGYALVDLRQFRGGMPQELWLDLHDVESGILHVRITIKDDVGLTVDERQLLLESKKAQETQRARKIAGLLGKLDPGAAEAAAGMLGSIEAFDPKSTATQAGSLVLKKYRRAAESLVSKHLLPKSLIGGDVAAIVEVEVVEGQNLIAADKGDTSDPYVKAKLGRSRFTTQVIYKTLNPKWLEKHALSLKRWPEAGEKCEVELEVWDRDRSMKDDFLGRTQVDLLPLRDGKKHELVLTLKDVKSGTIRVIIQVIDLDAAAQDAPSPAPVSLALDSVSASKRQGEAEKEAAEARWNKSMAASATTAAAQGADDYSHMGVLVANKTPGGISTGPLKEVTLGPAQPRAKSYMKVEILEAKDLEAKDMSGTSDPFVKGILGAVQFSTKPINKTLNPKWFDSFKLPVVEWHADNTMLTLEVYDKNALTANSNIGRCLVNLSRFRDGFRHDLWLRLENAKSGKIHVAITDLVDTMEVKSEILEVIPGVVVQSWKLQSERLVRTKTITA